MKVHGGKCKCTVENESAQWKMKVHGGKLKAHSRKLKVQGRKQKAHGGK
jgi:hypothetical protein